MRKNREDIIPMATPMAWRAGRSPRWWSAFLLFAPLLALGCDLGPDPAVAANKVHVFDEYDYSTPTAQLRGEQVYTIHCAGCHGVDGDGKGPAAPWLDPKPRDFTTGQFKFGSRPSGQLPTDEDLFHTITHGVKGTSMPDWKLLPEPDRAAVIAYLKTFSNRWNDVPSDGPVPMNGDESKDDIKNAILDGEIVYHTVATCWSCHPAYASEEGLKGFYEYAQREVPEGFRENLFVSITTTNTDGEELYPPDFTSDYIKSGTDVNQIYKRIAAGITGTAMPTWSGGLTNKEIWSMAYYVKYLAEGHRLYPKAPADNVPFAQKYPMGVEPILFPKETK